MIENPYESPQNIDKAKQDPKPTSPFVKQVLWLLFSQSCFLFFAALVLDGGRFFRISVITCIVMWVAFAVMTSVHERKTSEKSHDT